MRQLDKLEPWQSFSGPNYRQIIKIMMDAAELAVFGKDADPAKIMQSAQQDARNLVP